MSYFFFFFFQAEDGIRDLYVTGVQTCALPISLVLCRPLDVVPEDVGGMKRPIRLAQKLARQHHSVGLTDPDDVVSLYELANHADGNGGDLCFAADPFRKWNLISRSERNFYPWQDSPGRAVNQVCSQAFQYSGQRNGVIDAPASVHPIRT